VCVTLSDDPGAEWGGARGRITRELVESCVPGLERGPVLLCGPAPMMVAMREMLVDMGVPDAEILEEAFVSPPSGAVAADDAPAAVPVPKASSDPATVRFHRAGTSTEVENDLTVLEAAEEAGIAIPFECRSGICGQCKTRLVSGHVAMETQDALTSGERARGLILACQARPIGDVVVDA
jgi:ferredoxin